MDNEKDEVSIPPTICRDCVFCEYDDEATQVGCKFHGRVFKLENNGANLVGQDDGARRYFMIVGRGCNACRNAASLQQIPKRKWLTYVEDRVAIQVDYIVQVTSKHTIFDVLRTINSIEIQSPKPISIIINFSTDVESAGKSIGELIGQFSDMKIKTKWQIEQLTFEKVVRLCKGIHYVYIDAGDILPENYAERINEVVNYDMERVVAVLPSPACNALFIQRKGAPTLDKILGDNQAKHFVRVWEDLIGEAHE